jgi:xanthine dehydrogenase accessory factor
MAIANASKQIARDWIAEGRELALATLVDTAGSSPLAPGAMMLIDDAGRIEGSVTGGCVEGALVEEAREVLAGAAPRVRTYGSSEDLAAGVGLMCGGTVHIFVERLSGEAAEVLDEVLAAAIEGRPAAVATLLDGEGAGRRLGLVEDRVVGGFDDPPLLDRTVEREMRGLLEQGVTTMRRYGEDGAAMGAELRVHLQAFAEPPRMIVFGAIDFSVAVANLAGELGYAVTIVDAREPFLSSARFSAVAEVVVDWPNRYLEDVELGRRDVVLVFTHDSKFDEPALISALATEAGYIGALGSRRTQRDRAERLREAGVGEEQIERIAAPCGLDIGARTPTETAVSILAEVISVQNARSGDRLSESEGPIHSPRELAS